MFNLDLVNKKQPKYLQLAEVVREAICKGQLLPGDVLPSVKALSEDLQFNRHTVMRSFAELIAEGWLESIERIGYKVVSLLPIETSLLHSVNQNVDDKVIDYRIVRPTASLPINKADTFKYNFSGGQPDINSFPFNEFKSYMSDSLTRPNAQQLGYGESAGTKDLISEVKEYLRKVRGVIDREIVITNGSQEAIFIAAQLLLQQGDKVAVEALGYPPAMSAFTNAGAELVTIKQDAEGLLPDDLEFNILQGNIRLIYLTPLHQYPTTVTLTVARRMKIYQLAATHNIPIIEDDYDHEFHYRCRPLAPMISQDPKQLVIYISTFSKIMFPGARVGFMAINKTFAKSVESYRMLISHKCNVLMQSALVRWMKSGGFKRHLNRTTRLNLKRRDHAVLVLKQLDLFDFEIPDGGMALWLKIKSTKIGAKELAEKARDSDIYIQHEGEFHINPINNKNRYIRLGYAGMDEQKFAEGIKLLAEILKAS